MTKGEIVISSFLVFAIIGSAVVGFVLPGLAIRYFVIGNIKMGVIFAIVAVVVAPMAYRYIGRRAIDALLRQAGKKKKK